jgi:predicted DNA-binding WGR domain protein
MSEQRFEFAEGTSNKFWAIRLEGKSFTVTFGRVGTSGQVQTKDFASEEEASAACEKLIHEKLKKGYKAVEPAHAAVNPQKSEAPPTNVVQFARRSATASTPIQAAAQQPAAAPAETPEPAQPAAVQPAETPEPAIERKINLAPHEAWIATWKPKVAEPRPIPRPFEIDQCIQLMEKTEPFPEKWIDAMHHSGITPVMLTREEAHFWLTAITTYSSHTDPQGTTWRNFEQTRKSRTLKVIDQIRHKTFDGAPSLSFIQEVYKQLAPNTREIHVKLWAAAYPTLALLTPEQFFQCVEPITDLPICNVIEEFRTYVLPYLWQREVDELRALIRPKLKLADWQSRTPERPIVAAYVFAYVIGIHDKVAELVESWGDGQFDHNPKESGWQLAPEFVFGLGSEADVVKHFKRLGLQLDSERTAKSWIAHTEYRALGELFDLVEQEPDFIQIARMVEAPETAPYMVALLQNSNLRPLAIEWLENHPGYSLRTLIKTATTRSKGSEHAKTILKDLKRKGVITEESVGADLYKLFIDNTQDPEDAYPLHDASSLPGWLAKPLQAEAAKKLKLPPWIETAGIPALLVDKRRLTGDQMKALLSGLQQSNFETQHEIVKALDENMSGKELERFVWGLFQGWIIAGGPPKDKWAMMAVGLLGSDDLAMKLTALIKVWPGESQHQRAVLGLDCLRQIGTDTALMQINSISQKLKFKALKERAGECMTAIAKTRGFTREQLEDRIIPDCGLDERGNCKFDFGARSFEFVLGSDLKAMVRGADGKIKPDLPKPGVSDDQAKAQAAVDEWKSIKQQIKEVASVQSYRLEQAMITGRRWLVEDFDLLLVHHPLMTHLIRTLVWGRYSPEGKLLQCFRVSADYDYADQDDKMVSIGKDELVGVVHPLNISQEENQKWTEILIDYEILQVFPQLRRTVHAMRPEEADQTVCTRFDDVEINGSTLVGQLEKRFWVRGAAGDGGSFSEHSKYFPGCDITAIVEYDPGMSMGSLAYADDQEITKCYFLRGKEHGYGSRYSQSGGIKLSEVDPIAFSEVVQDLTEISAKKL